MSAPVPAPRRSRRRLVYLSLAATVLLALALLLWGRQTTSVLLGVAAALGLLVGAVQAVRRRGWRWLAAGAGALVLAVGVAPSGAGAEDATDQPSALPTTATTPAATDSAGPTPSTPAESAPTADPTPAEPSPAVTTSAAPVTEDSTAVEVLAVLAVKGRAAQTGYDRDLFGWNGYDFDRNGCDQRNDTLARDMTEEEIRPGSNGCYVLNGILQDRYAGTASFYERADVDIDHVVALSNAWQTGAFDWDAETRVDFGNDPLNLIATEASLNRQKGDGDAATWLPPARELRCDYVARQIAVKHTYRLWVTPPEEAAMSRILNGCPDQLLPTGDAGPTPMEQTVRPRPAAEPSAAGEPEVAPRRQPDRPVTDETVGEVHYENCTAAREAGADPVHRGDPGYAPHLDRDGDGVGCE